MASTTTPAPVAIMGMACRLPGGVNSPDELWDMLVAGRTGWGPIPATRWDAGSFYHPDPRARQSVNFRSGHFLDGDITAFDVRFFGIPIGEAKSMDVQQRQLLEVSYEAVESAGLPAETLRGSKTGVFLGLFTRDFERMAYKDNSEAHPRHSLLTGDAIMANRISYQMDFKGPSFMVDTGCVSVHLAILMTINCSDIEPLW